MITILWRIYRSPEVSADMSAFEDAAEIHVWALGAMKWAASISAIKGNGSGALCPASPVLRCEAAQILMNLGA